MVFDNYDNPMVLGNLDPRAGDIWRFLPEVYYSLAIVIIRLLKVNIGRRVKVGKLEDHRPHLHQFG